MCPRGCVNFRSGKWVTHKAHAQGDSCPHAALIVGGNMGMGKTHVYVNLKSR